MSPVLLQQPMHTAALRQKEALRQEQYTRMERAQYPLLFIRIFTPYFSLVAQRQILPWAGFIIFVYCIFEKIKVAFKH